MIPRDNTRSVEVVQDAPRETRAFGIKFNRHMFEMLSSRVYSDKIGAVIRETTCNGADAHKGAGNPDPIRVQLPSELHPVFVVEDFGTGMSPDDVMTLYTTYGESTKRSSNDFTGQLGIGSKAPFAYTDSFSIESRFNGVRYSFSAYIDGDGIPQITLDGEIKTRKRNGMTISIPVQHKDMEEFRQKAQAILQWFDPVPGGIEPVECEAKHEGWTLRQRGQHNAYISSGAYARMGNVVYRIDMHRLRLGDDVPDRVERNELLDILKMPIVIDFPIGTLDITASREELGYDEATKAALRDRLPQIRDDIVAELMAQVDAQPTRLEAFLKLHALHKSSPAPIRRMLERLFYRGLPLDFMYLRVSNDEDENGVRPYGDTYVLRSAPGERTSRKKRRRGPYNAWDSVELLRAHSFSVDPGHKLAVYTASEDLQFIQRRLENDLDEYSLSNAHIIVVRGDARMITDTMGNIPIKSLDDIEPIELEKSGAHRMPAAKAYLYNKACKEFSRTESILQSGDVYVRVFDKKLAHDDPARGMLRSSFAPAKFYGLPTRYKRVPDGAIHLADYIAEAMKAYGKTMPDIAKRKWMAAQASDIPESIKQLAQKLPDHREFKPLLGMLDVSWDEKDEEAFGRLKLKEYQPRKKDRSVKDLVARIQKRWPLLRWLEELSCWKIDGKVADEAIAYITNA